MKLQFSFVFFCAVSLFRTADSGTPRNRPLDCDTKIVEMDQSVNKMLVFNDPMIKRYSSKQDLNEKYCM